MLINPFADLFEIAKKNFFQILRKIPFVSKKINEECQKVYELFEKEVKGRCEGLTYITSLPIEPLNSDEIINLVKNHTLRGKNV